MLLTVDIGTSTFKSALWDFEGEPLSIAIFPLSTDSGDSGRHETDSGQWLKAFAASCDTFASSGKRPLSEVKAIVISGNGPTLVPVLGVPEFAAGELRLEAAPARLWLDRRSAAAAAEVSAALGGFVDSSFFLPKILGIKKTEPRLYERTRFFLGCPEFLACALTGEAHSVFPAEGFDRWFWNDDILRQLDLNPAQFPPFIRPVDNFGTLLPAAAKHFGLPPNIPVISGGPDFFTAILGSGTIKPGQVCDRAGTSEGINVCTANKIESARLMSYGHPIQPFWNLSGTISTTGKAVQWGKELLGLETYDEFYALAASARIEPESPVFLPYLAGERAPIWNPQARGVLQNLSLATGRPEFARSILEGICFAIRHVLSVMEESGARADELRVAGSAAGCDVLNQLKADVTGREALIPVQKEAELLGLAAIGAYALGAYNSLSEAAHAFARIEKRVQPDEKKAAHYDQLFEEYRETSRSFTPPNSTHSSK
ncbi:MAG TPA: hypothetical protein DEQ14_09195 [Treponema sp.]|nr:hypothetical protein [Treponema sp.]